MSNVNGVIINKSSGNLNTDKSAADRIMGLIAGVTTAPSGLAFDTSKKLTRLKDAEDIGIDAAYDTANSEVLHANISEFFRLHPAGTLWIRLVSSSAGAGLTDPSAILSTSNSHATQLLLDAAGDINVLALMTNYAHLAGTYVNGLPTEVEAAISAGQTFANWAYTNFMPVNVILEGCDVQVPVSSLGDLRALSAEAPNVSVLVGQDAGAADKKRAAMGAILGMLARRDVATSIGYVADGNLTDSLAGLFTSACLTNGTSIETYQADWQSLNDKGYIFVMPYIGYSGYYFNDDHTASKLTNDEHQISLGRVKNKAAKVLREAYLPFVKSKQLVDSSTGKLPDATIKYLESVGTIALDKNMTNKDEISGRKVVVDPTSDLLNSPQTLKVNFGIVPAGKIGEITGNLTFVTSID